MYISEQSWLIPPLKDEVEQLRKEHVLSMAELRQRCGTSHMSIFRTLRRHGYLSSYNHNGTSTP